MVQFCVEFRFPHLCSFPIFELFCNCNCIPIRTQPTQNWPARCIYSLPSQNARGFEKGKRQSEQISLKPSFSFFLEKIELFCPVMVGDLRANCLKCVAYLFEILKWICLKVKKGIFVYKYWVCSSWCHGGRGGGGHTFPAPVWVALAFLYWPFYYSPSFWRAHV